MTHWTLFIVLVVAGLAGCCASSTPPTSTTSATPSKAGEFFSDPKVAALALSLERGDWAGAAKALRAGADVNATGKDGMTLARWTMDSKNKPAFEWLFNHGADPNLDPGEDRCVLFLAARANDPDWLRVLLAHKANPNLTHKTSIGTTETPLLATVDFRRMANLKALIAVGADINYQGPIEDGAGTAAIDAASLGWFEGTYVLLEAGADFRVRTTGGWDLVHFVADRMLHASDADLEWGKKVLQLLRSRGADVDGALKEASDSEAKYRKEHPWMYPNAK